MSDFAKLILGVVVASMMVGCGTLELMKERKDGNVVQLASAQHIKTGRMFGDGAVIAGTNAAAATSMLGGSTSGSMVAGGAVIVIEKLLNSTADDNDYAVMVTRPDDLLINLGSGPAKQRRNDLGKVRFTSLMDGVRIGDWVKVVKTEHYWTLIPCKLPGSGCQDKVGNSTLSE